MRFDLVFSYWIYVWYILYTIKITNYSPKFPLVLGLIDNIVMFVLMVIYGTSRQTIIFFVIINTLIKVAPLYYLRNEPFKLKDIYFTIGLFVVFIGWLHINEQSLTGNLKIIYESLLFGKDQTPFMSLLKQIQKNYKNMRVI